ncbi:MAG: helix-turn-helix domain-containing protein [Acidiferrobacterales bacterium]|nr:helix-turn-helix domain-containing protein [Acidiferrobacterales bacterium]
MISTRTRLARYSRAGLRAWKRRRQQAIRAALDAGMSIREVARTLDVKHPEVLRWRDEEL